MTEPLLEVTDLSVGFQTREGQVRAIRNLNFTLQPGETLGIVGESGSGKSTVALSILGLLPKNARVTGSVRAKGRELIGLSEQSLSQVRGGTIAYIPQDPLSSLNPAFRVGWQVAEAIWTRQDVSKEKAHKRAVELLELVGIPNAADRAERYPHEFSGGMRQRVVIAMAMANEPSIILADEPTTALDVTIQAQVLEALRAARDQTQAAVILITHDLGVVAGMADRVMVMYAGKAVETAPSDDVFYQPRMPYTLGLLGSLPRLDVDGEGRLRPIPGSPPSLVNMAPGCPFRPRCPLAFDRCETEEPALEPVGVEHSAACHRSAELVDVGIELYAPTWVDTADFSDAQVPEPVVLAAERNGAAAARPDGERAGRVMEVTNLVKHFPIRGGGLIRHQVGEAHAVCGVSFDLHRHETLGLVGESGCGKSTTARTVLQLLKATSGSVRFEGQELVGRSRRELRCRSTARFIAVRARNASAFRTSPTLRV